MTQHIIPNCNYASKLVLMFIPNDKDFCSALSINKTMWKLRTHGDLWETKYLRNIVNPIKYFSITFFQKYIITKHNLNALAKLFMNSQNGKQLYEYLKLYYPINQQFVEISVYIYKYLVNNNYLSFANKIFANNYKFLDELQFNKEYILNLPTKCLVYLLYKDEYLFTYFIINLKVDRFIEILNLLPFKWFTKIRVSRCISNAIWNNKITVMKYFLYHYECDIEELKTQLNIDFHNNVTSRTMNYIIKYDLPININYLIDNCREYNSKAEQIDTIIQHFRIMLDPIHKSIHEQNLICSQEYQQNYKRRKILN